MMIDDEDRALIAAARTVGEALLDRDAWEVLAGDLHQIDELKAAELLEALRLLREAATKEHAHAE